MNDLVKVGEVYPTNDGKEYIVGDFEYMVYSSSKDFYDKFIDKFEVEEWDYWDI